MIDAKSLERVRNMCGFGNGICLSSNGNSGGLGLWWRDINAKVISYSNHHFLMEICDHNDVPKWRAVGIYGWPEQGNNYLTWALMSRIKSSSDLSCVMFGDFNEIVRHNEKDGGNARRECLMDAFRRVIDDCELRDLGYRGSIFTWKKGNNPSTFIRERLDRFLGDNNWCSIFPYYDVQKFPIYESDHAPILLTASDHREEGRRSKKFKFEAYWLSNQDCEKIVEGAWKETATDQIPSKIAHCANDLSTCARNTFGTLKKRIKAAKNKLKEAQSRFPDSTMIELCSSISQE